VNYNVHISPKFIRLKPISQLRFDYDTTTIAYDVTTTHSTTTEVIEITICVRFSCDTTDYDTTTAKN